MLLLWMSVLGMIVLGKRRWRGTRKLRPGDQVIVHDPVGFRINDFRLFVVLKIRPAISFFLSLDWPAQEEVRAPIL